MKNSLKSKLQVEHSHFVICLEKNSTVYCHLTYETTIIYKSYKYTTLVIKLL
jgi:hypothetical protein